jgi:hypothetical protein
VSTSGHYQQRAAPVTNAELVEAYRANIVFDIWKRSRHSYGMPRIRNEFRQGRHEGISRTTTGRLMDICGAVGIHNKRRGGCTRPGDRELSDDLVNRAFDPDAPDQLWVVDFERHEALPNLALMEGHRRVLVAAGALELRAARPLGRGGGWTAALT